METLENKTQMIAVKKVLEEMQKAEEYVKSWKASWYEQLLNAHCLALQFKIGEADIRNMERKYEPRYNLANVYNSNDSIGIPLITEILVGDNTLTGERNINFELEFGRIDWFGMDSKNATRFFSFHNNGLIKFSKDNINKKMRIEYENRYIEKISLHCKNSKAKKKPKFHPPKRISYDTSFNVLSNDFDISITKDDNFTFSLKGNILTERFNDIEIIRDINVIGTKLVRITKKNDKQNNTSVVFEAVLNLDDSLKFGGICIKTYKSKGKVNGTYRFDVSRKKGVRANFYSRKGKKVDLISNPTLLSTANNLLLPTTDKDNSGDAIVSSFADSTQNSIIRNLSNKVISFDNSDFNMEAILEADAKVIEMVKCIKGELPLAGLVERVNTCLNFIAKEKELKLKAKPKSLKLELPSN